MARKRRSKNSWLPPNVYRGRSAYEYKVKGMPVKPIAPLNAKQQDVWLAYHEIRGAYQHSIRRLFYLFWQSRQYDAKAEATKKDYEQSKKKLLEVFGDMEPEKLRPAMFRKYMDKRGEQSETRANREKALMQVVFAWSLERDYVQYNPIRDVKAFSEKPRDRYVTDDEYMAVYRIMPLRIQVAMDLSYLCAMRLKDVCELTYDKCGEDGIFVQQSKTGKKQIKAWNDDLRAVIESSKQGKLVGLNVVRNLRGKAYTTEGFKSMWQKHMKKAFDDGLIKARFHFHDIKAKSISDYEGDKKRFSGHKTSAQVDVYDRKTQIVTVLKKRTTK